ncbi:MAG TPA: hypothetical protein VM869_00930, partial [Enhygromyxa sp.]|nr:hypothetical protein [Enhygromyxa sp.]
MRTRLVWALTLLLLPGCKRGTQAPEDGGSSASDSRRVAKRAITPLEVCEHLAKMAADEAGLRKPEIDAQLMRECESELALEAGMRGTDNWNAFGDCVLGSRSEAELQHCNASYPLPGPAGLVASDGSRELEVCEHMIEVMMLETAAQSGEVPQMTADGRSKLEEECARSMVAEQKPQRSDAAYQE